MSEIVAFVRKKGVPFRVFDKVLPNISSNSGNTDYYPSSDCVAALYREKLLKPRQRRCSAGLNKCFIGSGGEIYPCELKRTSFGNACKNPFLDIWLSKEFAEFRKSSFFNVPCECKQCEAKAYCYRCPVDSEIRGLAPDKNVIEYCHYVKNIYQQVIGHEV
jgi:radical SAM protein with 4Fe4S-binding SPASM domain